MVRSVLPAAALATLFVLTTTAAHPATLIGDTVSVTYQFPGGSPYTDTVIVGPGTEVACPGQSNICSAGLFGSTSLDFGATTISFYQDTGTGSITSYTSGGFNGWTFTGLNFGAGIAGVTFWTDSFDNIPANALSFTANSISLNLAGARVGQESSWTLTLIAAVPLPATLPLALVGFGSLLLVGRRRRV